MRLVVGRRPFPSAGADAGLEPAVVFARRGPFPRRRRFNQIVLSEFGQQQTVEAVWFLPRLLVRFLAFFGLAVGRIAVRFSVLPDRQVSGLGQHLRVFGLSRVTLDRQALEAEFVVAVP